MSTHPPLSIAATYDGSRTHSFRPRPPRKPRRTIWHPLALSIHRASAATKLAQIDRHERQVVNAVGTRVNGGAHPHPFCHPYTPFYRHPSGTHGHTRLHTWPEGRAREAQLSISANHLRIRNESERNRHFARPPLRSATPSLRPSDHHPLFRCVISCEGCYFFRQAINRLADRFMRIVWSLLSSAALREAERGFSHTNNGAARLVMRPPFFFGGEITGVDADSQFHRRKATFGTIKKGTTLGSCCDKPLMSVHLHDRINNRLTYALHLSR